MSDTYKNFTDLSSNEIPEKDFRIVFEDKKTDWLIMAPHGGRIEPGTSDIALGIAATDFSFYCFEGLKDSNNKALHITSANFDEPTALDMALNAHEIFTIHCCKLEEEDKILIGGLDQTKKLALLELLLKKGFSAKIATKKLLGINPNNICNRGQIKMGIQLELRRDFIDEDLAGETFELFIQSIRNFLASS